MDIDQRDIKKGLLLEILPKFYSESISYLSELNEYRMYAEVWSNKRNKELKKRSEIWQEGYLKTLESGEEKKRRKIDKVRFDYFVVADSVNYIAKGKKPDAHIQMGGIQTNSIINKIIKSERRILKKQPDYPSSDFHSKEYLPETFDIKLDDLELNPEIFKRNTNTSNTISRLCVAWPFLETIVFDFAGMLEDYSDACLLGTLIKEKEEKATEDPTEDEVWFDCPKIDSYV